MVGLSSPDADLCLDDAELLLHIVAVDHELVLLDPRQTFGQLLVQRCSGPGAATVSHSRVPTTRPSSLWPHWPDAPGGQTGPSTGPSPWSDWPDDSPVAVIRLDRRLVKLDASDSPVAVITLARRVHLARRRGHTGSTPWSDWPQNVQTNFH